MTLFVHRAERSDTLAAGLAELLRTPLADVFSEEVVCVPARGVERWLTQQLSHSLGRSETPEGGAERNDGICAAVRFPSPVALLNEVINGPVRHSDPWAPDALVWPLLEVIDESADQQWCATLGSHLGVGTAAEYRAHRQGRRYAVARRIAGLFDSYAGDRPGMLAAWKQGSDTDGAGTDLPEDLRWQAELWRRVRDRLGTPDPLARRHIATEQLRGDRNATSLPERLSLFGPTRLTTGQLEVLTALAVHRDVHLWIPHPSPVLWNKIADSLAAASKSTGAQRPDRPPLRRADETVLLAAHPLLASLGRDARELQLRLSSAEYVDRHHNPPGPRDGEPPGRPDGSQTLLGRLQRNIRDDRAGIDGAPVPDSGSGEPCLPDTRRPLPMLAESDRSVQVHACHGPARQVEVLRDVLAGLLAQDPTLEPRDVLVMCPDIEAYAPLIAAAFGLADVVPEARAHPAHRLRVRLADRALTQTNPLLAFVARLLELAESRITASQVLDLASAPPVRSRFGFDDDDLDRLAGWVARSGVRWGFDAPHRSAFGLQRFAQNTWRSGLDRILLGVAMADEDGNRLGLALPLDDVGSGDVELAGRFAELLDRLQAALDALTGREVLRHWMDALEAAVDSLTATSAANTWQQAELRREFGEVVQAAGSRAMHVELGLSDVRALLRGRLGGRPTRANFRTGTLTVCTMVPMRSVPHRVICLLGLDDGVYPRNPRPDGDDILARNPTVGERDARGEDRQLMLDAILAATEHLVVTYTGADERTGAPRPPAVPLGELLDALDGTATAADGSAVRASVLVRHPLQPFDFRNVFPGGLGRPGPFSYDPVALQGARAAAGTRRPPAPFLPHPLPPGPLGDVELADLVALLVHPARGFLSQRLDVATRFDQDDPSDSMTVALDSLSEWALGERLLRARLAGVDEASCRQAEWRRGVLPPGPLGQACLDHVLAQVAALVERVTPLVASARRAVDVSVALGSGREVRGTVAGVHGTTVVSVGYSKLGPKPQLAAWISLLALVAADPDRPWTSVVVGRGKGSRPAGATFGPLDRSKAAGYLDQLVDLYDRGLREVLPVPVKTSFAYAAAVANLDGEEAALQQARLRWVSDKIPAEDVDSAHAVVWGSGAPFDQVFTAPAPPDERWSGQPSRLGELSMRLWAPLLAHRRLD